MPPTLNVPQRFDPRLAWVPFLAVAGVVLTCAFVLAKPVSTAPLPFGQRMVFWALHIFPALTLLQASQTALMTLPGYGRGSIWLWVALAGVLGAGLFTPWAFWLDAVFGLDMMDPTERPSDETLWAEYINIAPILCVLWLALNAGRSLRLHPANAPEGGQATNAAPRGIQARIPVALGQDLIALSAELHYVRVRTTTGTDLVLYPFGTAVADLADRPGLQVHRSHWVMLGHVDRVDRVGQRALCHLSDGTTLPVSRSYRAALERAVANR